MAKIAFCQDIMVEYMGYMCMSSVLKEAGHSVEVFIDDQTNEDLFINELKQFNPDIVGFSLLSPTVPWALKIAKRVKEEIGAITIFGNVHCIVNPQMILEDGVDIVCLAEGEFLLKELADCIDKKQSYTHIEGFWIKTKQGIIKNPMPQTVLNLDKMPFHDRSIYDKYFFFRHSKYVKVSCGRGCPFRCAFCSNAFLAKHFGIRNYVRKRNPALIIEELEYIKKIRNPDYIFFIDEVFWVDNDWLRTFLSLYKDKIAIPFTANFRWGEKFTENDVRLLKEAGLRAIIIGVETANERQRIELLNKPARDKQIFQITEWFHRFKIDFTVSAFFGLPDDTVEDHINRLAFFRKIRPTYLWTSFFEPYQGISLIELPEIKKYIPENKPFEPTLHHGMYLNIPNKNSLTNLKKIYFLLMLWPKSIPFFRRLINYKLPIFFDILFISHFTFYVFKFEHVSIFQYLYHIKLNGINTFLRKRRSRAALKNEREYEYADDGGYYAKV